MKNGALEALKKALSATDQLPVPDCLKGESAPLGSKKMGVLPPHLQHLFTYLTEVTTELEAAQKTLEAQQRSVGDLKETMAAVRDLFYDGVKSHFKAENAVGHGISDKWMAYSHTETSAEEHIMRNGLDAMLAEALGGRTGHQH